MSVNDIPATADGTDVDFSDRLVSGIDEYKQAALFRLQNDVTFIDLDYGLDLQNEIGQSGGASLGLRASAAIMNDTRFTATLLSQSRTVTNAIETIALSFDIVVDETQETFSLEVLVANNEVRLVP